MNTVNDLMTIEEVCKYLGIGRSLFDEYVKTSNLPVIKLSPRILRVRFLDLQRWIDERANAVHCSLCGKVIDPKTEFEDEIALKEFGISGLCQEDQEKAFVEDRE